jgi:hypothetical protein
MSAQDLQQDKLKLINWISQSQDFSLLQKIKSIFEEESIVAYTSNGEPLTLKEYNQKLKNAEKSIEKGDVYSTAEVKKIVASWKK